MRVRHGCPLGSVAVRFLAVLVLFGLCRVSPAEGPMKLTLRSQQETSLGSGRFHIAEATEEWLPEETAIIVCDVWDYHHCLNAVRRLEEFAPRLDAVLKNAREQGVTIIHSPSDCMPAYEKHPARVRTLAVPQVAQLPHDVAAWCSHIPAEERAVYPIDQSDGGEDDDPTEHAAWAKKLTELGRNPNMPWQRQSDLITIDAERDFVSDKGDEVWNVLEARGIKNVILTGVHVNMCVLGRPFGLRQMARNGKRVALMRDMTDAMYNPERWPYVSHFSGNHLIISHIERFVCPTLTSDQFLGGEPFRFSKDTRPHVVVVIAEDPYDTKVSLPKFVDEQLRKDFRVTVLHASESNRNSIPGLSTVQDADLLLLSARRRVLPHDDMQLLRDYVASGKPIVALRSASHAFALREGSPPEGLSDWPEFDADVIGGNYHGSYPDELRSTIQLAPTDKTPGVLRGVEFQPFVQGGHMYKTGPLKSGTTLLLEGHVEGHPAEPVAWIFKRKDGGQTVYFALGHPDDFQQSGFVQLLRNAVYWGAGLPVPESHSSVAQDDGSHSHWQNVSVPTTSHAATNSSEAGWYRCVVYVPNSWDYDQEHPLVVQLGDQGKSSVDGWLNGIPLGRFKNTFTVPQGAVIRGDHNLLVLRVRGNETGILAAPVLRGRSPKLSLEGTWQQRFGPTNAAWEDIPLPAKFGGGADVVFAPEEPLWTPRPVTRPGEFTPGIEGPACDAEGNILAVNYLEQGTIGRVSPNGSGEVLLRLPGDSVGNGIRFDAHGNFFIADYVNHNIWRVDAKTRELTLLAHNDAMNQPNDVAIADDGTLYASDPNWAESTGKLWRIDVDGTTTLLAENMGTTNGIEVSPDGKSLYVNESAQRNVWAFTITADKTLADKRLIRKFEDHGFDGMRVDVDGNLYISRYGKGTVVKMTPSGEILREIPVLGLRPSNVCFGGPDGCTVYVTEVESTRLVSFRVDRPGRSWEAFQK
ncbi:MAG: SMP-30/gluconolactonase/LRE family protein [Planctomycetaceae bacterium]